MFSIYYSRACRDSWRKIASLTMSAVSSTFRAHCCMRWNCMRWNKERQFALIDGVAFPTVGSLVIVFQVRNSVRPMHLFGHTRDHDYYFELPGEGERDTQSITR